MPSPQDSQWMAQALRLAERGLYSTSPNPRVGCMLVKNDDIVGSGWHERAGEPHAEVHALREAGAAARGATAYVTLEPCSHHGRTPPCAEALIEAGVARVVVAAQDPNPEVAGAGIARLCVAGIVVECGLMEAEARELNIGFFARMTHGTPWVRSKIAMSLDGRTALGNGKSQWITGDAARQDVQRWRARSCAVMTGINTVLADDPQLNVREIEAAALTRRGEALGCGKGGQAADCASEVSTVLKAAAVRQPLRVVLDSQLRIPLEARVLYGSGGNVLIYTALHNERKMAALQDLGATVVVMPDGNGQVDLPAILRDLAQRGCNEVLVEAGSTLNGALLRAGLADELLLYIAPQLLGDAARGMAQLGELTSLDQRVNLKWQDMRQVGEDLRILAKMEKATPHQSPLPGGKHSSPDKGRVG
ncbi:MAG TPA: bifunctional diaminohydroxyphosphoribosylaminopyrimidine deaminase/5-amino-6-(5-phosphoribosylamino)uracil reductase RibD [Gallionella sp.]|nr:bifunctional diaminohydroxyphosphoribosylaminopyrimidine deaminase/5-amino-6-(5-phosphoribosylamino)uracil reductase RibD [Gallionella sp.]